MSSSTGGSFSVRLDRVTVLRADRPILVEVDLTLTERSRLAVVGANGVGKSTLLRTLAGEVIPASGSILAAPANVSVGLVRQELVRDPSMTVRQLLAERTGVARANEAFEAATAALSVGADGADDEYADALERWLDVGAADFDARLERAADDLALPTGLLDASTVGLSGGQGARVGLAAVMLSRFDLTLLDEPTNDLDVDGLERLEAWVEGHSGGLVIVSHDRAFLDRAVTSVLEIDPHAHTAALFQGGWEAFLREREVAQAQAERRYQEFATERERLSGRAQKQREWADKGASRATKAPSDGDKFRRAHNMAQTEKLAGKASATQRAIERLEVVDKPWENWELRFTIAAAPRSASVVATLDAAVFRRGDFSLGPVALDLRWAERVVIVGPNGGGKSTLIDGLTGRLEPVSGRAHLGPGVVVGELGQRRDDFDRVDGSSLVDVFEVLAQIPSSEARSILAKFGLAGETVGRPASSMSPGERTRARLALFQARGVNLLILDEPTNHLDLAAIEQLETALAGYPGTLVVVSHDRRFLENVVFDRRVDIAAFDRSGPIS